MAVGYRLVSQRLGAVKFYFQRITEDQHVFFPLIPRDIMGLRNNNRLFWQQLPGSIVFNARNDWTFEQNIFNTDSSGFIELATPFRIIGEGKLNFTYNSAKIVIKHMWEHRFLNDDGTELLDDDGNLITINNSTAQVFATISEGVEEFFDLSQLAREIEVYPYQINPNLMAKAMEQGRAANSYRIGIKMDLSIKAYSTQQDLMPVRRFGRFLDFVPDGATNPRPNEMFANVSYSNPSINFRQGTQAAGQSVGSIYPTPGYVRPPEITEEQHANSTDGQTILQAVDQSLGTPNRLVIKEQFFNLPDIENHRFSMPSGLAEQVLPVYPVSQANGPGESVANMGVKINEVGNYSIELQVVFSIISVFISSGDASFEFGVRLKHIRDGATLNTFAKKQLFRVARNNEVIMLLTVPKIVALQDDLITLEYVYESSSQGDTLDIKSELPSVPKYLELIKEEF